MSSVAATTTLRSPEGVELHFRTAGLSERFVAIVLDLTIVLLLLLGASIVLGLLFGVAAPMLVFFLLRHSYFLWSETRGRGTTFGKRRLHLRVVRADGGPLTVEVLLARNLTREVEFFLPVVVLLAPDVLFADHAGIVRVAASLWVLLLLLFPFCNRHRLRIGDLLAGTRVVVAPPVAILLDLADARSSTQKASEVLRFRPEQLAIYGERELAVLEDLLRKSRTQGAREGLDAAATSIARRIGWQDAAALRDRSERFLRAFYAAQREHLEQSLLLGKRRLVKKARGPDATSG